MVPPTLTEKSISLLVVNVGGEAFEELLRILATTHTSD